MPLLSESRDSTLAAQHTIREAFNDLKRTVSESDSAGFPTTTLEDVIKTAHDIEDELAARQSLRNMRRLTPLFTGLQYYAKSIEVVCNGTPYLPWIWAPIKLILKVKLTRRMPVGKLGFQLIRHCLHKIASDYVAAFEKIVIAYARIAEPLARFQIIEATYSDSSEVQRTLAVFYSDILRFHKEAYKFVKRGGQSVSKHSLSDELNAP